MVEIGDACGSKLERHHDALGIRAARAAVRIIAPELLMMLSTLPRLDVIPEPQIDDAGSVRMPAAVLAA